MFGKVVPKERSGVIFGGRSTDVEQPRRCRSTQALSRAFIHARVDTASRRRQEVSAAAASLGSTSPMQSRGGSARAVQNIHRVGWDNQKLDPRVFADVLVRGAVGAPG